MFGALCVYIFNIFLSEKMRFLLACGLVCLIMFSLVGCEEIETDLENDAFEDVLATGEKLAEKRGLLKRRMQRCPLGFWCLKNSGNI